MKDINTLQNVIIDHEKLRNLRGSVHRNVIGEQIGVGGSQIANIEQGIRKPSGDKLLRLMLLYGVKAEDIATTSQ